MKDFEEYHVLTYRERWALKRREMIKKKVKELIINVILSVLLMSIFILAFFILPEEKGHYRYNDGGLDGTGIYYEWVPDEQ